VNIKNLSKHNVRAVEALLDKTLKKIFSKVDLHYEEWDINRVSFEKVKKSPKLKTLKKLSIEYDNYFKVAESLNIRKKINPKYIWFQNLFEANQ